MGIILDKTLMECKRLKEERDAAEIRREQAEANNEANRSWLKAQATRADKAEKDATQWEDRALTAESALMDLEASLDKESTRRA